MRFSRSRNDNESVDRMLELAVLRTPAVAIDGELVLSGQVPKVEELEKLLGVA
jgi:predicted thioredoxin/glutaredoxin